MSFRVCEESLQALLETIDGFDERNVTLGDFGVVNEGYEKVAILQYGGLNQMPWVSTGPTSRDWTISIHFGVQYRDDITVHEGLSETRQAIMDLIQQYPQLNNPTVVFNAEIVSGRPEPDMIEEGNVSFRFEELVCLVQEISNQSILS